MNQQLMLDPAKLNASRSADWYRHDIENVTSMSSNAVLGIDYISVQGPTTQAQVDAGIIAQVYVRTTVGSFPATVFRGKKNPGTLYLQLPFRTYEENGEKKRVEHFELTTAVRAQILRHVESKCSMAQVQAPVQEQQQFVAPQAPQAQVQQQVQQPVAQAADGFVPQAPQYGLDLA